MAFPDDFAPDRQKLIERERRALLAMSVAGLIIMATDAKFGSTLSVLGAGIVVGKPLVLLQILLLIHWFLIYRFWRLTGGTRQLFTQEWESTFVRQKGFRQLWANEIRRRMNPATKAESAAVDHFLNSILAGYVPRTLFRGSVVGVVLRSFERIHDGTIRFEWESLKKALEHRPVRDDPSLVKQYEYLRDNAQKACQDTFNISSKSRLFLGLRARLVSAWRNDTFFEAWLPLTLAGAAQSWVILALMFHYLESHHYWKFGVPMLRAWPNPFSVASPA